MMQKKQMDRGNVLNSDNYYHRLGMCEVGKKTAQNPFYPLMGMGGGILKEVKDISSKSIIEDMPWNKSLNDSMRDFSNNWEGLNYGLNNPDKDCRVWLRDLDINTNTWNK